jgi:hypothetical protein
MYNNLILLFVYTVRYLAYFLGSGLKPDFTWKILDSNTGL